MGAEQWPKQAMFSPSPVIRQEKPSSLRTHVPETEESGSDAGGEPEDRRGKQASNPTQWRDSLPTKMETGKERGPNRRR